MEPQDERNWIWMLLLLAVVGGIVTLGFTTLFSTITRRFNVTPEPEWVRPPMPIEEIYPELPPVREIESSITGRLVGYWKFDTSEQEPLIDSSGRNFSTYLANLGKPTAGIKHGAVKLDGESVISLGNMPNSREGAISVWVKRDSGLQMEAPEKRGVGIFLGREVSGVASNLIFGFDNNSSFKPKFWLGGSYGGRAVTAESSVRANRWTHLAVTWEGNLARIYVNGKFEGDNQYATPDSGKGNFTIGGVYTGAFASYFKGAIDELMVFKSSLSPEEVGILARKENLPVARWEFESGLENEVVDSSGNESHGTWRGDNIHKAVGWEGMGGSFNGQTDEVVAPSDKRDFSSFTAEFWINRTAIPAQGDRVVPIGLSSGVNGRVFEVEIMNDDDYIVVSRAAHWGANGISWSCDKAIVPLGEWTFVAVTYDQETEVLNCYINGKLAQKKTTTSGVWGDGNYPTRGDMFDMSSSFGYHFEGSLDNVAVYDEARSLLQIKADMGRN